MRATPLLTAYLGVGTGYGMEADWRHGMYQGELVVQGLVRDVAEIAGLGQYGVVDHVARYEDLTVELERIAERLRLPNRLELPRTRLADEGISMAEYRQLLRENIISLKVIDKEVNAKVIVTAADIQQLYENNMKLFQESSERVLIKAIYLKLDNNASVTEITDLKIKSLKLYDEIKKGTLFDMLAMKHKEIQGEFERGVMIPVLDNRIFSLKEGEVSEPVWTKEGVYILKAVKIIKPSYKPVDAVREQIHEKIYEQKREEMYNEWLKRLWDNASVTIPQ